MLKNWFKILLFNLKRSKVFSLLTIVGLSFGICATILASLYWKQEHSYDQWNPHKDHIYEVLMDMGNNTIWNSNVDALGKQIKEAGKERVDYMYYYGWIYSYSFKVNAKIQTLDAYTVQGNFFDFFPFEIIKGNSNDFNSKPKTIALSEDQAITMFGKENPIGQILTNEENITFTVTTVYKLNKKSTFSPNAIVNDLKLDEDNWNNFNSQLLIKLKDPSDINNIKKNIDNIIQKNIVEEYAKRQALSKESFIEKHGNKSSILTKLTDARLFNENSGLPNHHGNYKFLVINVIVSLLILILSIVNQINLNTAYALKRIKEFSIRRIIGANKKNIVAQIVFETSVYTLIAIVLGLAMVEMLLPHYNTLLKHELKLYLLDTSIILIIIFIITIITSAILPALYILRINIQNAIKGQVSNKRKTDFSRQTLLVLQFGISFLFICGGIIINKQVNFILKQDVGFKGDQIIAVTYYSYEKKNRFEHYKQIAERLKSIKGIKEIAGSNITIGFGSPQSSSIHFNNNSTQSRIAFTEPSFLPMLGVTFLEGRNFDPNIASDSMNNIILNETAVKELDIKNPINQSIKWNDEMYTVIGVIKDLNATGFNRKIDPIFYIHGDSSNYVRNRINNIFIKIDANDMQKTIANIEKFWNEKVDPHYPFDYEFIDTQFERTYINYIQQRNLFGILNIVVISIALFGLYALASFSIERRMKEIAIKKVLGAETASLIKDLTIRYIYICVLGFLMAIIPSYYVAQEWLNNFTYRIEIDFMIYLIAFVMMFILTLAIVISKGYSATRMNPLTYLKYE